MRKTSAPASMLCASCSSNPMRTVYLAGKLPGQVDRSPVSARRPFDATNVNRPVFSSPGRTAPRARYTFASSIGRRRQDAAPDSRRGPGRPASAPCSGPCRGDLLVVVRRARTDRSPFQAASSTPFRLLQPVLALLTRLRVRYRRTALSLLLIAWTARRIASAKISPLR